VLAGFDNLQVCSSVGLLSLRKESGLLAIVFALCEILARWPV